MRMIDVAVDAGADAVKIQTYTAAELVADPDRMVTWGPPGAERTQSVGEMFDEVTLPRSAHRQLFEHAKRRGIALFSTPFSLDGVAFLRQFNPPAFKFASSDVNYHELIAAGCDTGLPVILSLGKSTFAEAAAAVDAVRSRATGGLALLHCVAQYPAPPPDANLRVIPMLAQAFPFAVIGYSDHVIGNAAALGAVSLGAKILEKHFTLSKGDPGPDHWFSADPDELAALVRDVRVLDVALGTSEKRVTASEVIERHNATRSLVVAEDVVAGTRLRREHLKVVRPGWGISPADLDKVLGLRVPIDLARNTVLTWDLLRA
jgi:sialic acid synthase SpsE